MNSLKRFFTNKNTVTVICVILAMAVLFVGYNYRIKQETDPVKVPYAKIDIQPRTLITEDMVGIMEIPRNMVNSNTITQRDLVVGLYANYNTLIPAGSVFYKSTIVTWNQMPDSAWADIKEGQTVVSLPVNTETTYGNSIFPGNYIDLYISTRDNNGLLIFGKLIESIEVLAVKDSSGNHVFEKSANMAAPASLIFAVDEELHLLLRKAMYLGISIVPVPRNANYTEEAGQTVVSSEYLQQYIQSKTVIIPDEQLPTMTETTTPTAQENVPVE